MVLEQGWNDRYKSAGRCRGCGVLRRATARASRSLPGLCWAFVTEFKLASGRAWQQVLRRREPDANSCSVGEVRPGQVPTTASALAGGQVRRAPPPSVLHVRQSRAGREQLLRYLRVALRSSRAGRVMISQLPAGGPPRPDASRHLRPGSTAKRNHKRALAPDHPASPRTACCKQDTALFTNARAMRPCAPPTHPPCQPAPRPPTHPAAHLLHRLMQRRLAVAVLLRRRRARRQQQAHHRHVARVCGALQRGGAAAPRGGVWVGSQAQQQLAHVGVALPGCIDQRRVARSACAREKSALAPWRRRWLGRGERTWARLAAASTCSLRLGRPALCGRPRSPPAHPRAARAPPQPSSCSAAGLRATRLLTRK